MTPEASTIPLYFEAARRALRVACCGVSSDAVGPRDAAESSAWGEVEEKATVGVLELLSKACAQSSQLEAATARVLELEAENAAMRLERAGLVAAADKFERDYNELCETYEERQGHAWA